MIARSAGQRWYWSQATSPVSPFLILPGVRHWVSQMDGVRPPSAAAPSTW